MLTGFIAVSLASVGVIAITSLITYEILRYVWKILPGMTATPRLRVLLIVIPIFAAHIISIWIYAVAYFLVENFTSFGALTNATHQAGLDYASFVDCLYFSAATYTSLGFGDIVPTHDLRMLSSAEVLNGLVMIGWTVSFTYLTMEKFWSLPHRNTKVEGDKAKRPKG